MRPEWRIQMEVPVHRCKPPLWAQCDGALWKCRCGRWWMCVETHRGVRWSTRPAWWAKLLEWFRGR